MTSLKAFSISPSFHTSPSYTLTRHDHVDVAIDEEDCNLLRLSGSTIQDRRRGIRPIQSYLSTPPLSPPSADYRIQRLYSDILASSIHPRNDQLSARSSSSSAFTSAHLKSEESRRIRLTRSKAIIRKPNTRHREVAGIKGDQDDMVLAVDVDTDRLHSLSMTRGEESQDWAIFINNNYVASEASTSACSFLTSSASTGSSSDHSLTFGLGDQVEVIQSDCDSPMSMYSFDARLQAMNCCSQLDQDKVGKECGVADTSEEKRKTVTRELIQQLREERRRMQQGLGRSCSYTIDGSNAQDLNPSKSLKEARESKDRMRPAQLQTGFSTCSGIIRRSSRPDAPRTPHTGDSARMVNLDTFSPSSACYGNAVINARASIYAAAINDEAQISFSIGRGHQRSQKSIPSSGFCFDYNPKSPLYLPTQ